MTSFQPTGGQTVRATCSDISVIVCAYTLDRFDDLVATVESVYRQTLPAAAVILVIDYNDQLLAKVRERFPMATVVPNAEQAGLSGARNTGLALATSEIVAFIDDDAVASDEWLAELAEGFSATEKVLGVGGRIVPLWESDAGRPGWFPEEFDWVLGCTYRGMAEGTAVRNLIGANMSFRRDVLVEVGGFSHELGRSSGSTSGLGDEETGACIRATQLHPGHVFLHTEHALVEHRVPPSRTTWRYYRERCWGEGLSKANLSRWVGSRDGLAAERHHVLVALPMGVLRALGSLFRGDVAGPARAAAIVGGLGYTATGYLVGRLRAAGERDAGAGSELQPTAAETAQVPDADDAATPPARRPRVLMVTPRFFPLVGGVEHHVAQVAKLLAKDADITVLTTDTTGELPAREVLDGVAVERVPAWPRNRDYYISAALYRRVHDADCDLVHVQSYHTAVAPFAMLACVRSRKPFVLTFHGGGHSSRVRGALRGVQWALLRPLLARAERLIAVARFEAERFSAVLRLPRGRFVVIPNGSDLPTLPAEEIAGLQASGKHIIVSAGRLERYKGHQRVIEAMPDVLAQVPDAELRILGTGPYQPELERLVERLGLQERVSIGSIPPTQRREMAEAFAASSLVVLMSEFETHPLAVIEALAMGRPALVADTSGLRELAEEGLARAVPLSIPSADLAAAIVEELRHPRQVPPVAAPTWQDCADSLLALYRDVLGAPLPRASKER